MKVGKTYRDLGRNGEEGGDNGSEIHLDESRRD